MKKFLFIATLAIMAACSPKAPEILVLYYSQGGTTKTVAEEFQTRLGADIEAIVPVNPYDGDYNSTIQRGREELAADAVPEIQPLKSDLKKYDVIFLGYPVWFGTYALPVRAVLDEKLLAGKKIVPFCTFGSGGLDTSTNDMKAKLPGVEILPGYGVRTARIDAAPAEIDNFLKEYGFIEGESIKLDEFPAMHPVTEEEAAIFDAAVKDYAMIQAKAEQVASRALPNGTEYLFGAGDIKVYVTVVDGQAPVFTQVLR